MDKLIYLLWVGFFLYSCKQKSENKKETNQPAQISICAPEVSDKRWYSSNKKAPILSGLTGIHFKVSTKNTQAQQYFDQGLMLSFGFNHAEAARSFYEATRQDSTCAMC